MPFIPHTPESLVRRSDSKDPATTCKGITASGRPCRRPIGTSPQSSPAASRNSRNGVVAILEQKDDEHDGAAAFFCWQHQDQAETLVGEQSGRKANIVPVQPRTSIDTLVDRLGVLDVEEDGSPTKAKRRRQNTRPARKETLPQKWQDMDGPLLAVRNGGRKTEPKARSNLGLFCCIRSADDDPLPPPRHRRDSEKHNNTFEWGFQVPSSVQATKRPIAHVTSKSSQDRKVSSSPSQCGTSRLSGLPPGSSRPSVGRDRPSQTEDFLSLIPKTLSPQTTALLLAELAKPVSHHDEEGYIYMFWLTNSDTSTPDSKAASSLLGEALPSTPNGRRKSDILQARTAQSQGAKQATILLKIGRASNIQRRMNEWTRQCGYNLSLIRFYPHVSSSSTPSTPSSPPASPNGPAKVLHAHKVERLIHLELADQRVKRECESCGKEHREWFEVESSRQGLKRVDDVIRRWTSWGQRMG